MIPPSIDVGKANGWKNFSDTGEQSPEVQYVNKQRQTAEKLFASFIVTKSAARYEVKPVEEQDDYDDLTPLSPPVTPWTSYFSSPRSPQSPSGFSLQSGVSSASSVSFFLPPRNSSLCYDSRRSSVTSYGSGFTIPRFPVPARRTSSLSWRTPNVTLIDEHDSVDPLLEDSSRLLPPSVCDNIIRQLKLLHLDKRNGYCIPCWTRDIRNLALTSRSWHDTASKHLYETISITEGLYFDEMEGHDADEAPTRLEVLHMLLRARPDMASLVKNIEVSQAVKVSCRDGGVAETRRLSGAVAALVIVCPNLERLGGLCPLYEHELDGLSYALSTRRKLKERIWRISAARGRSFRQGSFDTIVDEDERQFQYESRMTTFVQQSVKWSGLESLVLYGQGEGSLDHTAFVATFRNLRALKHLAICRFGPSDFNDQTLAAVPPLQSLRLQHVAGVSERGLHAFSHSIAASCLTRFVLVDLNVRSFSLMKAIFGLPSLRRLSVQQATSTWHADADFNDKDDDLSLESDTLEYLHVDVPSPSLLHCHIATAIQQQYFPNLRRIRCTSDHEGIIQQQCSPLPEMTSPRGTHLRQLRRPMVTSQKARRIPPSPPTGNASSSPSPVRSRSLEQARLEAQDRAEDAANKIILRVVIEEEGMLKRIHTFRGFCGNLTSNVEYFLEPDIDGSDIALSQIDDIMGRVAQSSREAASASPSYCHNMGTAGLQSHLRIRDSSFFG